MFLLTLLYLSVLAVRMICLPVSPVQDNRLHQHQSAHPTQRCSDSREGQTTHKCMSHLTDASCFSLRSRVTCYSAEADRHRVKESDPQKLSLWLMFRFL